MRRIAFALAFWTATIAGYGAVSPLAHAQPNEPFQTTPDWGDHPLLMSQFGELCTMCVAYLYCTPDTTEDGATSGFMLYHFQTKDFWGQIATIWDYFARWFDPVTSESRPATIFDGMNTGGSPTRMDTLAYLDEAESRVDIGGTWIHRDSSVWFDGSGQRLGTCMRPGIPEAMDFIAAQGPWQTIMEDSAP